MAVSQVLIDRYRRLFRFYDRDGDGLHSLKRDFNPVALRLHARWQGRVPPFADLLQLLLSTYQHENSRRDQDGNGTVEIDEFVASHQSVVAAYLANRDAARAFIARAAGGFFDVLDLDRDGALELADLEAFAAAYGHPVEGIAANLDQMLSELELPAGRLPREAFLTLVEQYWFDPSPTAPGRLLFSGMPDAGAPQ
jgi:Ca2+-binding EF-hand superfamily protein